MGGGSAEGFKELFLCKEEKASAMHIPLMILNILTIWRISFKAQQTFTQSLGDETFITTHADSNSFLCNTKIQNQLKNESIGKERH